MHMENSALLVDVTRENRQTISRIYVKEGKLNVQTNAKGVLRSLQLVEGWEHTLANWPKFVISTWMCIHLYVLVWKLKWNECITKNRLKMSRKLCRLLCKIFLEAVVCFCCRLCVVALFSFCGSGDVDFIVLLRPFTGFNVSYDIVPKCIRFLQVSSRLFGIRMRFSMVRSLWADL